MGHSRTFLLRGAGSGVTTSATGTTNTLAKFTGASTIGDSLLSESSGTTVEQKSGAIPQEFRVFGAVSGSKYGSIIHNSLNFIVRNNVDDAIYIQPNAGAGGWFISGSSAAYSVTPQSDSVYDIGTTILRVRTGYFAGVSVREGANQTMGVVTLSGASGSAIVYTTKLVAGTRIFLTEQNSGGTPGVIRVTSSTNLVSFTVTSSSITDTSVVAWWLVVPN